MLDELILLHTPSDRAVKAWERYDFPQSLQWRTCLRQVVLTHKSLLPRNAIHDIHTFELYRSEHAYQFLLEIICGLHSPLLGETEVLGQFRQAVLTTRFSENNWGRYLRRLTVDLLRDAKRIRQQYLQHLGHRSYGSHASQWFNNESTIGILGAGQLANELLPWLANQMEVRIYARNPSRAITTLGKSAHSQIHALTHDLNDNIRQPWPKGQSGLIVAAPLTALEISNWIEQQSVEFNRILDLRSEAAADSLPKTFLPNTEVMELKEFFASLAKEQKRGEKCATQARAAISQIAQRQLRQTQCRPYGWEDACA
ncbi:MAG: hypothetical protein SF097_10650 [Acidobacteriota bacterium]|nr:hypothetical protein [Acidobacteriota bacterium]